jgi:hypothetical protein
MIDGRNVVLRCLTQEAMVGSAAGAAAAAVVVRLLGPRFLEVVSSKLNKWTHNLVPVWNPFIPKVG